MTQEMELTNVKQRQRGEKRAYKHHKRFENRIDIARKNLLDSIHYRNSETKHNSPCSVGDRHKYECLKLPRVKCVESPVMQTALSHYTQQTSLLEIADEIKEVDKTSKRTCKSTVRKSSSQNVSLPEIITEFNMESGILATDRLEMITAPSPTETFEDKRALGKPYEDYLKQTQLQSHNPYRSHYRPITPGLLESLNKQRVSWKVKTEQWIKSSKSWKNSCSNNTDKLGNFDNTNLTCPKWIYINT